MNTQNIGTDTIAPRYPHLHPEALAQRDETESAMAAQADAYVRDWIEGDLVDQGDTYTGPVKRLLDDDLVERLGTMLDHHRAGRDRALQMGAEALMRRLEEEIKKDWHRQE